MKSRFCPSPTGLMHLGNARTALFNALIAKANKGSFLLRIEDTDKTRSTEEYVEGLFKDLEWMGLHWQDGPHYQSKRQATYDEYYQKLEKEELAFPCFCTDAELAMQRKAQLSAGQPPRYSGKCYGLSKDEIQAKVDQGLKPTLRFHIPEDQTIEFDDLVRGPQTFNSKDIGDFIIRRADGSASFMFCNAVDDALMEVTHALRGEDHLTNTPRQILILKALKLTPPTYGHIPLIVAPDGTPLSKRHGSRSIQELREAGYLPEAVINYLARLGHYYTDNDLMSLDVLAAKFSNESLGRSPARFDENQLKYWQKQAVLVMDDENYWTWLGAPVHELVPKDSIPKFIETVRANTLFPIEGLKWARIFFSEDLEYGTEELQILTDSGEELFNAVLEALAGPEKKSIKEITLDLSRDLGRTIMGMKEGMSKRSGRFTKLMDPEIKAQAEVGLDYSALVKHVASATGIKGKALYQPLRIALTTQKHGPEMEPMIELIGMEKVRARIYFVLELFK